MRKSPLAFLPALVLSALLAACAAPEASHSHGAGYGPPGAMGGQGGMMDMQAMCERHRKEMAGKSPAEQRALMEEHMKNMPPEMRERMKAMHEQCQ